MQTLSDEKPPKPQNKPRLRLPFEKRDGDIGEWSYDHRAGICITLIAYLLTAIVFIGSRIELGNARSEGTILIEFPEQEREQQEEPDREEVYDPDEDFRNVRNLTSNENAELNAQLQDDRGTNASEIYSDADALSDQMKANREAYEEGLRREQEIIENARRGTEQGETRTDRRIEGRVAVSFSFSNPIRSSVNLVVPAYRCEGGGEVTVDAVLDNNGRVVSASVLKSRSSSDNCMQATAIQAARSSRFNVDNSAPARHRGTITYTFIPQ